jgi:tetratricopeptide (TPR) repeat protein
VKAVTGTVAGVVVIAVLMTTIVRLQMVRERWFPQSEPAQQILYVSSPAVLTRLALSYDALVSDLYWIRAIQYYGGTRLSEQASKSYELLYPLLDLTTSLDPNFNIAYEFGAFFLSEKKPGGPGRSDLAIRLLEKGIAARPDRWQYPYDVGFVHYRDGDYAQAAGWFTRAAATTGAQKEGERADIWLRPLAASTLAAGGDTKSSRVLYEQLLKSDAAWLRADAARRLKQLDAIDSIAFLEQLTAKYESRVGDPPPTWDDLVRAGDLTQAPRDPEGYEYVLNPWWGDVTLSEESPLWPLPTEKPA